jgi:hypothetical protein
MVGQMKDVVVNTTKSLILDSGTTLITGPPAEVSGPLSFCLMY